MVKSNPKLHEKKGTRKVTAQSVKEETTQEKEETVIVTIKNVAMNTYEGVLKTANSTYNLVKGVALKITDKAEEAYVYEQSLIKALGLQRYLLERLSKAAIFAAKFGAVATLAYYVQGFIIATIGLNPFSLAAIGAMLLIGIIAVAIESVISQKEAGLEVSAETIGSHIIEAVAV